MRPYLILVVLFAVLFPSGAWAAHSVKCSKQPDGTPCDDGNICTVSDVCHAGVCRGALAPNGTVCDDGNACTATDACQNGTCVGSSPVTCTAPDQCHTAGTCNPKNGTCSNPKQRSNGSPCNDDNACTLTASCQHGTCVGFHPLTCSATDQCHDAGTCDPASGRCSNPAKPNGSTCNDGNACTQTDTCQNGACGGTPVTCTASDQCHDAGTCNPTTGQCSSPPSPNTKTCDDGATCTTGDTCNGSGQCVGTPLVCTVSDQCHEAGTCNPTTGQCSSPPSPNTKTCDDGAACTTGDTCNGSGQCVGTPLVCTVSDQCHEAGTCNPTTGQCSSPPSPNTKTCDDGAACTTGDTCNGSGQCVGTPLVCTASDQCHEAGTCNPTTGQCSSPPSPNTKTCDDGAACTTGDTCNGSGQCVGTPLVCTASDQCHDAGTCNPTTGQCSSPPSPNTKTCDDGAACTTGDTCNGSGQCVGTPLVCTASDQCHDAGTCDPASGSCSNPAKPDGTACDDGDVCTPTDTCQAGVCSGGTPLATAGSIIVFENLQLGVTSDPLLSLANESNQMAFASCFYADIACVREDFAVQLAPQSQMEWQAAAGSSGLVPALPPDFSGELVCVETAADGSPINSNALVGSTQYPGQCPAAAVSIQGNPNLIPDDTLCLGGGVTVSCPNGAEYGPCPSGVDPARIASCWSQSEFVFVCGSGAAGTCANPPASDGTLCDDGNPNTVNDVCSGGVCVGSCPAGSTLCGSLCVDSNTDRNNCGACGNVCASGTACTNGSCQGGCPGGTTPCGSVCVNPNTDPQNCGTCGHACASGTTCTGGSCQSQSGCAPGTTLCNGNCVNENTDPNNCGSCNTVCAAGVCNGGNCVTNQVAGSCLPTSSLAVLIQGTAPAATATAYVPMASWSETATGIIVAQLEPPPGGLLTVVPTTSPVNSCSSNSASGLTVCTGNTNDVYVLQGTTLLTALPLTAGGAGIQFFSGGSCTTCGVATDASTGLSWIAEGTSASTGQLQSLNPAPPPLSSVFGLPLDLFGQLTSEDISVDPVRHLILSALENGQFQIIDTTTNAVFNASVPFVDPASGTLLELDSTAEDCSTGIAMAPAEFSGPPSPIPPTILLADLSQATYTPGSPGTWSAPTNVQSFPDFSNMLAAGPSAIAVAPGSHLAGVTDEFGGAAFGVVQLPAASGVGIPSAVDYVAANMPDDPGGVPWSMGLDPHPMTAYTSPNTGKAILVISNVARTYLALVDMQALLGAPRTPGTPPTHTVDPTVNLVGTGVVKFVAE